MKRATNQITQTETETEMRVQPVRFNKIRFQVKRMLTIALVAISVLSASAQYGPSILNLRLNDNAPFTAYIDGQLVNRMDNAARITNLSGGKHLLEIYRAGRQWGHHYQDYGFKGFVILAGNAESWMTVFPEKQKIKFANIRAFAKPAPPCDPAGYEAHYPKDKNHDHGHHEWERHCAPAPVGPFAMNPADFGQLKQTIDNAGFENTRLAIFKQALSYNYFTTSQVRELMDQFWFEGTKLEVAKLAYPKTVDQNNYYLVNNGFSFSSSVDELGNYIAMR
jgi:hypothetical protein